MSITKLPGTAIVANTITTTQLQTTVVTQIQAGASGGPKVSSITYPNNATATVNTGNESIILTGTGFEANVQVYVNGGAVPSVSRTNANSLSFTTPALTTGTTYPLYVVNPDGGTAVVIPGMVVSAGPVWVTGSPLDAWNKNTALSRQLQANSDSTVSYALEAGSSLPNGITLAANGLISGTLTSPPGADTTTYNFTVVATDLESQKSSKAFSITATSFTPTMIANVYNTSTSTPTTGSFVVPADATYIYVYAVAGGGSGALQIGADDACSAGGGGAANLVGYRISVTPGETISYSVGNGGAGRTGNGNGNAGGNTTLTRSGVTIFNLGGGAGGVYSGAGGAGGSGGIYGISGGNGGEAARRSGGPYSVNASNTTNTCAGGGGGGAHLTNKTGGIGGTSTVTANASTFGANTVAFNGTTGGAAGTAQANGDAPPGNVSLAYGGYGTAQDNNTGAGGGAGAGIKPVINGVATAHFHGGGGGGYRSYNMGATPAYDGRGGGGFLIVFAYNS